MKWLEIKASKPLKGVIRAPGSKNSTLGLLAACCLSDGIICLENVPDIRDVKIALDICSDTGIRFRRHDGRLFLDPTGINDSSIDPVKSSNFRAAYYFIGGLLAKRGKVTIGYPGGDSIGPRPIDQHIKGFKALGAKINFLKDYYEVEASTLVGTDIYFDVISSGATINLMLAAVLAKGRTTMHNAARDPEIVDIAVMLNKMGARIHGAGTHTIRINGVKGLNGCVHNVIPDRLAVGAYLLGAASTGGKVTVTDLIPEHLEAYLQKLTEIGVIVERDSNSITVQGTPHLRPVVVRTGMYPVLGSDYQQPLTALLLQAEGLSIIQEKVFPQRFNHCSQLCRMGADITVKDGTATIKGKAHLKGTWVNASDIRAGTCLILAGLTAEGTTRITGVEHIERGHEDIVREFGSLGADIMLCHDESI
jgi:UDP-N-acetylglucosamine 1-carboxyvinyltransferase